MFLRNLQIKPFHFLGNAPLVSGAIAALLVSTERVSPKDLVPIDGYSLLRSVQSPVDLLLPHLPRSYTVPIVLSGGAEDSAVAIQ